MEEIKLKDTGLFLQEVEEEDIIENMLKYYNVSTVEEFITFSEREDVRVLVSDFLAKVAAKYKNHDDFKKKFGSFDELKSIIPLILKGLNRLLKLEYYHEAHIVELPDPASFKEGLHFVYNESADYYLISVGRISLASLGFKQFERGLLHDLSMKGCDFLTSLEVLALRENQSEPEEVLQRKCQILLNYYRILEDGIKRVREENAK